MHKRTGTRRRCAKAAILPIALALLLTSCVTQPDAQIEYVLPPALEWPIFPDPTGHVEVIDSGLLVDFDYWVRIADYVVDVDALRQKYDAMRESYEQ